MKEQITYLENKINSNNIDSRELKKKGNNDLSGILDDETIILEGILKNLKEGTKNVCENEIIRLSGSEIQSHSSRVFYAERLISQLPLDHDGRNNWLLNYGVQSEAQDLRNIRNLAWDSMTQSCELVGIKPPRAQNIPDITPTRDIFDIFEETDDSHGAHAD